MHREASMGTAQRGQQPTKPDLLTLSIPFHGNLGLSGNLLPCDVLALACLLSSACTHPWGHGLLPRFSVGSHLAVPADGNPRTSWHLLPQIHCRVCNSGGLSRAPRISFALIILMFTMQRPWCYCPCFTDGETEVREFKPFVQSVTQVLCDRAGVKLRRVLGPRQVSRLCLWGRESHPDNSNKRVL